MLSIRTTFLLLLLISLISVILSLDLGTVRYNILDFFSILFNHHDSLQKTIIIDLRLPRTIAAFVTGGLLALSGTIMQAMLRNPLADPYILGISGGGSFFSLILLVLGITSYWLNIGAFLGALISMGLVFFLARWGGHWSAVRLLLIGVIVASGWSALISLILTITPNTLLPSLLYWLLGDLSYAKAPAIPALVLCLGGIYCMIKARSLNLIAHGDYQAQALGVDINNFYSQLYFITALLTATAVSLAGTIGFVGLIVPHILRLLCRSDHRFLIPAAILAGGSLLTLADTLARTVIAPQQLPVGIIVALIGIPVFLYLLIHDLNQ